MSGLKMNLPVFRGKVLSTRPLARPRQGFPEQTLFIHIVSQACGLSSSILEGPQHRFYHGWRVIGESHQSPQQNKTNSCALINTNGLLCGGISKTVLSDDR